MTSVPELPRELYEFFPSMSAQTHEAQIKDYVRDALSQAYSRGLEDAARVAEQRDEDGFIWPDGFDIARHIRALGSK